MSRRQTHDVQTVPFADTSSSEATTPAPLSVRLNARLFAGRYDRQIENGARPVPGSPLALHAERLISARERNDLAAALRRAVSDADSSVSTRFSSRVPVHSPGVHHASGIIDEVCDRLVDPFPVRARGMARLRLLMSDGLGPMYRRGGGTLTAALQGVLATL